MIEQEKMHKKALQLLKELIRNKCVNDGTPDSGNELKSAKTLAKYFKSKGIDSYEIFESHFGRGNLLVTISGTDSSAPSVTYSGHIDVVPANPDEWNTKTFEPVEKNGWLFGRG